ncbi:hypothetical protein SISNIDRAFT_401499, partial [Sistotremastrum niveocremeum HHB9708]
PNEKWAVDGHEKLSFMGYDIYGIRDYWGKIHAYYVVPNARNEYAVEYLYLNAIEGSARMPLTVTSDKGTETGRLYARQKALRAAMDPDLDLDLVPAHTFVKSVRNIVIERSWRQFLEKSGRNMLQWWAREVEISGYQADDRTQRALVDWIWVPLIQQEVNKYIEGFNDRPIRRQPEKNGPSGASHNKSYRHPELFGGSDQLIPVNPRLIDLLLADHPGEEATQFFPPWFHELALEAYRRVGSPELSFMQAWSTFRLM